MQYNQRRKRLRNGMKTPDKREEVLKIPSKLSILTMVMSGKNLRVQRDAVVLLERKEATMLEGLSPKAAEDSIKEIQELSNFQLVKEEPPMKGVEKVNVQTHERDNLRGISNIDKRRAEDMMCSAEGCC